MSIKNNTTELQEILSLLEDKASGNFETCTLTLVTSTQYTQSTDFKVYYISLVNNNPTFATMSGNNFKSEIYPLTNSIIIFSGNSAILHSPKGNLTSIKNDYSTFSYLIRGDSTINLYDNSEPV